MDIGQALANAIRQAHEGGGRPVGSPRVPSDVVEPCIIASVWGNYVRVKRQGQTTPTGPIPWKGAAAAGVGAAAVLTKPMGNMNIGWVKPPTA